MADDDGCFWYTEGKCFLQGNLLPERWIVGWIEGIPEARKDLVGCAMDENSKCAAIPEEYIEWAEDAPDQKTAEEFKSEFQSFINDFTDHHRKNFTIERLNNQDEEDD